MLLYARTDVKIYKAAVIGFCMDEKVAEDLQNINTSITGGFMKPSFSKRVYWRLINAGLTFAMLAALSAFLVKAYSQNMTQEEKNYVQMLADTRSSPELQNMTKDAQAKKISTWIGAFAVKITSQMDRLIAEGRISEAKTNLSVLKAMAGNTGDKTVVEMLEKLEKNLSAADSSHNTKVTDFYTAMKANQSSTAKIQMFGGKKYITATGNSKSGEFAQSKAAETAIKFARKKNLHMRHIDYTTESKNGRYISTAIVEVE
jgi:hypothetical protein